MLTSPITLYLTEGLALTGRSRNSYARAASGPNPTMVRVHRGVYADRTEWARLPAWKRHLTIACASTMAAPPGSERVLVRESAAVVQGIPMVGSLPRSAQVAIPGSLRGRVSRSTTTHSAPADLDVRSLRGTLTTSPAQTVVDLACTRSFRSGLVSADAVLATGAASLEEMVEIVERHPGRPGIRRARQVLRYADGNSESPAESLSRAVMIEHRLPLPVIQYEVRETDGVLVARVDFYWPELRRAGEIDGKIKFEEPLAGPDPASRAAALVQRDSRLAHALGHPSIHWTWDDAYHEEEMLRRLALEGIEPQPHLPEPPNRI